VTATKPLPQHGTTDASSRAHRNALARHRTRMKAYGRWQPWTDAQPVRDHIAALGDAGIGWMRAARLAGIPTGTVSMWLYGHGGNPRPEQIRPHLAAKMLAVTPDAANLADRALVEPLLTVRQIQTLAADGFPITYLAGRLDLNATNLSRIARRSNIEAGTARAVAGLFFELANTDPAAVGIPARNITYIRNWAAKKGWASRAAWDGIDMADPGAFPDITGHCGSEKGHRIHESRGIPFCQPCREAKAEAGRECRATRTAARQGLAA